MMKTSLISVSLLMLLPLSACSQNADGSAAVVREAGNTENAPEASASETAAVTGTAEPASEPDAAPEAAETANKTEIQLADVDANGFRELSWEDLMPAGEEDRLREMYAMQMQSLTVAEGSINDTATQIGTFNVVKELDGVKIKLPGYTVPFDFSPNAEIREFLLVPYFGACLHAPPPPPNQTVFVKTEKPIRIGDLAQAVWVFGTLKTTTQQTDKADTAYTVILDEIEEYSY